ncbi:MAG TPA: type II toxin-antitoxin system VapC family toxin [Aldersonia sp.]
MRILSTPRPGCGCKSARSGSDNSLALLADSEQDLLFSAASSWEIAIKVALGKLTLPIDPAVYVPDRTRSSGVVARPVTHSHALAVATLPLYHRDPFYRLLVTQARLEDLTLLTADRVFEDYDVSVRWSD